MVAAVALVEPDMAANPAQAPTVVMASPPRRKRADRANRPFVTMAPRPGMLLLWESWLRHDVPINESESERISISFNYGWGEG